MDLKYKINANTRIKNIVLATTFGGISIWSLSMTNETSSTSFLLIFLLLLSFYIFYDTIRNSNSVIVNHLGIYSKINGMGLIEWKYIADLSKIKTNRGNFLKVKLHNNDKLLYSKNFIVSRLMQTNIKKFGTPVVIPENEFGKPISEIIREIELFKKNIKSI